MFHCTLAISIVLIIGSLTVPKDGGISMEDLINKIVLGDCLQVMTKIPDKSVDLIRKKVALILRILKMVN